MGEVVLQAPFEKYIPHKNIGAWDVMEDSDCEGKVVEMRVCIALDQGSRDVMILEVTSSEYKSMDLSEMLQRIAAFVIEDVQDFLL